MSRCHREQGDNVILRGSGKFKFKDGRFALNLASKTLYTYTDQREQLACWINTISQKQIVMENNIFKKLSNLNTGAPLGDRVYQELRRGILEGLFPPGTILPEDQLTRAMGASRTPVREALMRLKGDGLVLIIPRKGARVLELDREELNDLIEVREVFETAFFDRAVKNIKRSEFKKIRERFRRAEESMTAAKYDLELWRQRRTEYLNIDYDFHSRIVSATGNRLWIDYYKGILGRIKLYSHHTVMRDPAFFEQAKKEHYAILDAILASDLPEAKWLLREHIRSYRKRLIQSV
jgi:DNA-binding GntR family transcriptional regulator